MEASFSFIFHPQNVLLISSESSVRKINVIIPRKHSEVFDLPFMNLPAKAHPVLNFFVGIYQFIQRYGVLVFVVVIPF